MLVPIGLFPVAIVALYAAARQFPYDLKVSSHPKNEAITMSTRRAFLTQTAATGLVATGVAQADSAAEKIAADRYGSGGQSVTQPRIEPEPILDPDLPVVDAHHHLWLQPKAAL